MKHFFIAHSLRNIFAKNNQNRFMCVKVIARHACELVRHIYYSLESYRPDTHTHVHTTDSRLH